MTARAPDDRSSSHEPDWTRVAATARGWITDLVGVPSVTNSAGETVFAPWLQGELLELPYFRERPQQLRLMRTQGDPWERYALLALVRGSGQRTVVLTGHYDVVSAENYGALAGVAFEPEALLPRLLAELQAHGRGDADARAVADLESGDFLPGRAALDMKGGLAVGLTLLEAFAGLPEPVGNLLFLAVPDEEEGSAGMRTAARLLPDYAREHDLQVVAAINLDAEVDQGDGERGRAVFLGSVGKLLPSVLLIGRPTHAGAPFDGLSAGLLAAELIRAVENNPELADPGLGGEGGPPPALLQTYDLKPHYDVTTPSMIWCAFNLLIRSWGPDEVLARFVAATRDALRVALGLAQARRQAFTHGGEALDPDMPYQDTPDAPVYTYQELWALALARAGDGAATRLETLATILAADATLDTPRVCQRLMAACAAEAGLEGPAAVVGFGSLFYPPCALPDTAEARRLEGAVRDTADRLAAQTGQSLVVRPFFPGVSDMSFLGTAPQAGHLGTVRANTPAWSARFGEVPAAPAWPAVPTVNAGPWGREYHQRTERLHLPYALHTLPKLVWGITSAMLRPT